jgi:hypothetical protein
MMADDEAEWFSRTYAENTLVRVELPSVLPQRCESLFKIGDECDGVSGLHDHIIDIGATFLLSCLLKQDWIARWYVAPAFFNPNDMVV